MSLAPMHEGKRIFDLSALKWTLSGHMPSGWMGHSMELGFKLEPEIAPLPAQVPGSVQAALRSAGLLTDWFVGFNSRDAEWVENRDWVFSATLPDEWFATGRRFTLRCGGLDGNGVVIFNGKPIGPFNNAFLPYQFDLTKHIHSSGNQITLVFSVPPRWLGQIGFTSQMKDWKPRFNYTWDWIPRIVQTGPWEPITLSAADSAEIQSLRCRTDWDVAKQTGSLWIRGILNHDTLQGLRIRLSLTDNQKTVLKSQDYTVAEFVSGIEWRDLPAAPWQPNGSGDRQLYSVVCQVLDDDGHELDHDARQVGFKHIDWQSCRNAPADADPWICVVNGQPTFLQGINWTPILPTFADLTRDHYRHLVEQYAKLGCNLFRVWGGAFLEKSWLYELCDEFGVLIWQEFPLSSSGYENWPHEDESSMDTLTHIAASYIARRQHHASLLMWCGGNELQGDLEGNKAGTGKPVGLDHPLMKRLAALVEEEDPGRRFVPSSASGPRFLALPVDFGKGLHWDVHGPWKAPGATPEECEAYWRHDDALFRSETGAPGASSAELIRRYAGGLPVTPGTLATPLWRRSSWWIEWDEFTREAGREPVSLEEYVAWSQARQANLISLAIRSCKSRFPGIGGIILWMGHDSFPCSANTSIIDFEGNPKPAALAASAAWKTPAESLQLQRRQ